MNHTARRFIPLAISVLTVSDTRTEKDDKSGSLLVHRLQQSGHRLAAKRIVKDDVQEVRAVLCKWFADNDVQVVLSTGGTGITGRDGTPEAVRPLLDKEIPGFGEMFRVLSFDDIGTSSLQSRALAGVASGVYIFVLPGSSCACATAWDKIIRLQLDYRTRPCNLVELMPRLLEK